MNTTILPLVKHTPLVRILKGLALWTLACGFGTQLMQPAVAQSTVQPAERRTHQISQSRPARSRPSTPKPPRSQRPNQTRAGGSLSESCSRSQQVLSALVPTQNPVTTRKSQPTVWVYVPYTPAEIQQAEFVINVGIAEKERLYRQAIALPPTPGFVGLTLPAEVSLKPGIPYRWYLTLQCVGPKATAQFSVDAGIQVVGSEQGEGTIAWYDEVEAIAQELQLQPENREVRDRWRQRLAELGLAELANQPLQKL